MSLEEEIKSARTEIVSDGYDMSVGEIINLYRDEEILINPAFQRLFRWDISRKTKFIESLLLGIPIPPIFVYQNEDGVWELIDGLQRLSTIFEFVGILKDYDGNPIPPSVLEGTKFLPSLAGKQWGDSGADKNQFIGRNQQLQIKRARLRVEILKQQSDPKAKYELFQRLNTGGVQLSEQEVRNCVAVMINKDFFDWLHSLSEDKNFLNCINQTPYGIERQMPMEIALRFIVYRNIEYQSGLDVHEYLDDALIDIATNDTFNSEEEENTFRKTFELIHNSLGNDAFRRWDGTRFKGQFLMSLFEVIAIGVSKNLDAIQQLDDPSSYIIEKSKDLWSNEHFNQYSGAGVRGTSRLANLIPFARNYFDPQ